MKLNPLAFNTFLENVGQEVLWRRASACPCIADHSGAAKPNCPLCVGKGQMWASPVLSYCGVTQQKADPRQETFGLMQHGDVTLTIPSDSPMYAMGHYDRVTALNTTNAFSIVLTRGLNDTLSDRSVIQIDSVFWLNPAGTARINGGIPLVSAGGVISWFGGVSAPAPGTKYTISGRQHAEYYAYQELPVNRNMHMGASLPKRMHARLFDLWGR